MIRRCWPLVAAAVVFPPALLGQNPTAGLRPDPRAQVLVLGVFHFQDAGLDAYQQQFSFDVLAPERQRQVEEVVGLLAAWRPTRVAVEASLARQSRLDSLFTVYPARGLDTLRNEIYQLGFRLAKRLGHPGVFAVDAQGRRLDSALTEAEWERLRAAQIRGSLNGTDWDARFAALYRHDDSLKAVRPLRELLAWANAPERLTAGHGHYLVGTMLDGERGDYLGADGFVSGWYNRNLRIYSNLVRLIRSPDDRILLVIGAGHVPILKHLLESSPAVTLVPAGDVLR